MKGNSSIEKHCLKHKGSFHKEKLKNKFEDKSLNWEALTLRRLALDASFFHYSMMDSTYYCQLRVNHQKNTYWILPIDYNNRPYHWFSDSRQSSLLEPKHVFLLHISTKVRNLYKHVAKSF